MRPLMLFAGEFWDGASGLGLADGFAKAGFDVATFDIGHYIAATDGDLRLRALSRLTTPFALAKYRDWVSVSRVAEQPAIFFTVKGPAADRSLLETLKARGARLAMFYPDVDFDHAGVDSSLFALYDFIFTTKRFHLPWMAQHLRGPAIHHVDHGYSTRTHLAVRDLDTHEQCFDVGFVGNHSDYKHRWLLDMIGSRPNLSLVIAGPNWARATRGSVLQGKVVEEVTGAFYRRLIARSRINLAIHHGPTKSGWADSVSTRTFEIPAARGFMLHVDNDEVRTLYDVGSEIDVFATPQELAERIDFYLAQPERRVAMIDAAYVRAVPAYSYDARAARMAEIMGFSTAT